MDRVVSCIFEFSNLDKEPIKICLRRWMLLKRGCASASVEKGGDCGS
jgi:hypothetical protein